MGTVPPRTQPPPAEFPLRCTAALAWLLVLPGLACAGESVRYTVTVVPARAPLVDVEMELSGFGADQLLVSMPFGYSPIHPDGDGVEDLRATDLHGRQLESYVVDGRLYGWDTAPRRISYSVRLTHRTQIEELARRRGYPYDGREQPYLTRDQGLLAGGAILLTPDRWELDATVEFRVPAGWSVVVPWQREGTAFRPPSLDALARDYLAVGNWQTRTAGEGASPLTIAYSPRDVRAAERLAEAAGPLLPQMAALLGPNRDPRPCAFLLEGAPEAAPLALVSGDSLLLAIGSSEPDDVARLLGRALPRLWERGRQPFSPELHALTEGLNAYLGEVACVRAGPATPQSFLAWVSALSKEQRSLPVGLSLRLASAQAAASETAASLCCTGGALRAAELDIRLRASSGGTRDLAGAVRFALSEGLPRRTLIAEPATVEQWLASLETWWPEAPRGTLDLGLDQPLPWSTDDILVALGGVRPGAATAGQAAQPNRLLASILGLPAPREATPAEGTGPAPARVTSPPEPQAPAGPPTKPAAPEFSLLRALPLLRSTKPVNGKALLAAPPRALSGPTDARDVAPLFEPSSSGGPEAPAWDATRSVALGATEKPSDAKSRLTAPRLTEPKAPPEAAVKPGPMQLAYRVELDPKDAPLVRVTLTVASPASGPLTLAMPLGYAYRNVTSDYVEGLVARDAKGKEIPQAGSEKGRYRWASAPATITYQVRLAHREEIRKLVGQGSSQSDAYEHPFIGLNSALLTGAAVLLVPPGWDGPAAVRFDVPKGWRIIAPWPRKDGAYVAASARALAHNYVAAGDWTTDSVTAGGTTVEVAFSKSVTADRAVLVSGMKRILEEEAKLFDYSPAPQCCVLFTTPGDRDDLAGSTKENSVVLVLPKDGGVGDESELLRLVAHETIHLFQRKGGEVADDLRFFGEGFTEYYARVVCVRAGVHSDRMLLRALSGMLEALEGFPRGLTMEKAQQSFFDDLPSAQLCYYGGVFRALELDARLRAASGGQRTLDDLLRYLYNDVLPARHRGGNGFTYAEWQAALGCWYPEAPAGTFDMRLSQPLPWDIDELLGPAGLEAGFPSATSLRALDGSVLLSIVRPSATKGP